MVTMTSAASQQSKKPKKQFGESLDKKSETILEQLAIYLLTQNKNIQEFFGDVTFRRTVKGQSHDTVEADDFFMTLHESGIISKNRHHKDLRNYLAVNQENPEVLLLDKIQSATDKISENEKVLEAARALASKTANKKKKKSTKHKKIKKAKGSARKNKGEKDDVEKTAIDHFYKNLLTEQEVGEEKRQGNEDYHAETITEWKKL